MGLTSMIDFYYDRQTDYRQFKKRNYTLAPREKGGTTFAFEKLNRTAFHIGEKVKLKLGVSRCHKDDNFVKKTGRDLAVANMVELEFKVIRILQEAEKVYYKFENSKYELEIMFMDGKPFSRLETAEYKC